MLSSSHIFVGAVAKAARLQPENLFERSNRRPVREYKQASMFVMRRKGKLSYTRIAAAMHLKSHDTVLRACISFYERLRRGYPGAVEAYGTAVRCYVRLERQEAESRKRAREALLAAEEPANAYVA